LEKEARYRRTEALLAKKVFWDKKDWNLELLKAAIWLMKKDLSNLSSSNKCSKVLSRNGV